MDAFERELRDAFARRPAPPSLKRTLMQRRHMGVLGHADRQHSAANWPSWITWQKLAACLVLTATLAGGVEWHAVEERRKEEAAREQVLTALRITSHALNQMNVRLLTKRRGAED